MIKKSKFKNGYRPPVKKGRPPIAEERVTLAISLLGMNYTYQQVTDMTGISRSSLERYRKKYKMPPVFKETEDLLYEAGVIGI